MHPMDEFKVGFLSRLINLVIKRFFFSVMLTLTVAVIMRESLQKDPNALKWLLISIWVDVFAYTVGLIRGYNTGVYDVLVFLGEKSDKIGGKENRHEE